MSPEWAAELDALTDALDREAWDTMLAAEADAVTDELLALEGIPPTYRMPWLDGPRYTPAA